MITDLRAMTIGVYKGTKKWSAYLVWDIIPFILFLSNSFPADMASSYDAKGLIMTLIQHIGTDAAGKRANRVCRIQPRQAMHTSGRWLEVEVIQTTIGGSPEAVCEEIPR